MNRPDNECAIYLEKIEIETTARRSLRIKLQIDDEDVEIRREGPELNWTPSRTLIVPDTCKMTMTIKAGHTIGGISIRKQETQIEVNAQEVIEAFWQSVHSISRTATFERQPTTIRLKFRASHTFETTRAAVQELEKSMESYRSFMTSTTEHRIDTIIKYGVVVSEMNPFAKMAFSLVNVTFDLLKEQRKYDETVADLASDIGRILPFAKEVMKENLYDEVTLLDRALRRLYDVIGDAAEFICIYAKRSPARRAAKSAIAQEDHKKIKELQGDFVKLREDFGRAVDVETLKLARDNARKLSSLTRDLDAVEDFRILSRLKPMDVPSYQEDRSCMEGTRTALLDDIITWAVGSSDQMISSRGSYAENIFWLHGIPGVGKTAVANSLCRRLHKTGNLGGTFFCRRDDPNLSEPKRVMPTLIYRLAEMWSPYRKLVAQTLRDDPHLNADAKGCQLLLKQLESLQEHPTHTFVLVIDALDECGGPSTRGGVLKTLMEASRRIIWLKIVITSRQERDIIPLFEKVGITGRDLALERHVDGDIRLFMKDRMVSVAKDRNLEPGWPGEERLNQIVSRSGGLFIFANTLCLLVDNPDPEEPLDLVLSGESEEANAELHKLYSTILRSRIRRSKEKFQSFSRAIIVVATYRPLCDETLASLIGVEPRIVRSWVDELSSLLYRDESEGGGVRVRHLSVIDFFTGPACPEEFQVDCRQGNAELGLACIRAMMGNLKFNICKLETSYLPNADIPDLKGLVREKIADALQYSCMHWASHLCSGLDGASMEISRALDKFFAGQWPLYWLEVLSLMAKVPAGILALRHIKAYIKKFGDHDRHPAEDVLRFALAYYTPISVSTPHLYVSALPFSPVKSILWENERKAFPMLLDVCKGRLQSWPALPGEWRGHTGAVNTVAYFPDGQHIVSGSDDNTVRIWDAETGAAVGEPLRGHTGVVSSVAYSPDGQHIVSGSGDNTVRIWDAETGAAVGEPLRGHTRMVSSVAYSPDGQHIVSGSHDNTVRIWDAETGAAVGEPLRGHTDWVSSVAYSPDGRHIVSGSHDNTVRIWDAETGAAVGEPLRGHTGVVSSVAYSPDGQHIVSGSYDNTVRIWDAETGAEVGEPPRGHTGVVSSVAYSPDGQHIVSGSDDNTVRIWDAETGAAVGEPLRGHTWMVSSVAYSPDGQHIVSGSGDNTVRIWDAETGAAVGEPLRGHTGVVSSVAYSPDGQHIVSGSYDNTVRIWDAETGAAVGEPLRGHTRMVSSVAYSPDGQHIVSGSDDNTVRIWDAETGAAVGEPLRGHTNWVSSVAYSPDGQHIVSGSYDNTVRIWDAETGAAVGEPLRGHTWMVSSVAYSPDGQHIVSGSGDSTVRIWDAETGAAVGEPLRGHTESVSSVAYSPDGQHIVSGSYDNTVRIWDAETGAAVGEPLRGHTESVSSVAYSPDGQHIVSGSKDDTFRIWDAETGAAVGEPVRGHTNWVCSVAYSPDGQHIVSGSYDNTVRIWDAETGAAVGEPVRGHRTAVSSTAYSPDGQHIVSGSSDNTVRIWDAQTRAAVGEPLRGHTGAVTSVAYSLDNRQIVSGSGDNTIRIWDAENGTGNDDPRIVRGVSSSPSSSFPSAANLVATTQLSMMDFTGVAIPAALLDKNGWVRDANRLLFWVPEDCRHGLTCHATTIIPDSGRCRSVRLDFTRFRYGALWTEVYGGSA